VARWARSSVAVLALVVLLLAVTILGFRSLGFLEPLELSTYDWLVRLRPSEPRPLTPVFLITVTERDLQQQGGWPLTDRTLARALQTVVGLEPRAVGLDIYRDVPVPPGAEQLDAVLTGNSRIVVVTKFGEGASSGVPPPPVLQGTAQVGFNDILVDRGGIVRRGLLFLDDGTTALESFALRLALLYMQAAGLTIQPDPHDPRHLQLGGTTLRAFEPYDGPYVGADARGYQFLLDFKEGPAAFPAASLTELLTGAVTLEQVRDKVVLIGVTAESVKDNFYIPLSPGLGTEQHVPGVVVHAMIVSQLTRIALNRAAPIATLPEWQERLWILLWTAAGAGLAIGVRAPWRLSLGALAGLMAIGLSAHGALAADWWLPVVPPAFGWVGAAGVATAYLSWRDSVERALLMQLFSRHVSREVAESIWQHRDEFLDGGRPRSQRLTVTAFFSDLTGFTTVSEQHSPEFLMEWLNEYMEAMAIVVSRHGGVIRQYAGDSIVAIFGGPIARRTEAETDEDAVSAVACALDMEASLLELNRRWATQGRPVTGMRVGIFTGSVVAGSLGSAERSEYVTVGDTMNTASRLESFDKELFPPDPEKQPCRIFIGEPTLRRLADRFEVERVGEAALKGKEQSVAIYRVIGRQHQADPGHQEEGP
jgi:adenylate cyclase